MTIERIPGLPCSHQSVIYLMAYLTNLLSRGIFPLWIEFDALLNKTPLKACTSD